MTLGLAALYSIDDRLLRNTIEMRGNGRVLQ